MNTPIAPDSDPSSRQTSSPERVAPEHGGEDFPDGRKPAPLSPEDIDPNDDRLARKNAGGDNLTSDEGSDGGNGGD